MINVIIVGSGVIGERRGTALPLNAKVIACIDPNIERAKGLAAKTGECPAFNSVEEFFKTHGSIPPKTVAIVATINGALVEVTQKLLDKNIHCIVEKPAARSYSELSKLKIPQNIFLKIGFNHRFHPAFEDLQNEISSNPQDPIMYIRARYGNGARVGFDKEWRSQVSLSGGGELLDQGVHVLDLAGSLLGQMKVETSWCRTHFWNMDVDDNAWAILSTAKGQTFSFHVSSSEWKNEFRFEVYTRNRKYVWNGLGRSYGPETLTIYKMKPEMGPPGVVEKSYPAGDDSWLKENSYFFDLIEKGAAPENRRALRGGFEDALQCLSYVESIYKKSRELQKNSDLKPVKFFENPA